MDRLRQQTGDHPALAIAEDRLAAIAENLLDGLAGGGLDLVIRIEERQVEPRRQAAPDLGLAGAHQADQHDRAARREALRRRGLASRLPGLQVHPVPLRPCRTSARRRGRVLAYRAACSSIGAAVAGEGTRVAVWEG